MKTVLVVDDEPTVRFALAEGLADRRRGIKIATAANGLEAIAVLEAERVDLVLTDLRMPDMDGFELLAHLRRYFADLPVIVMTALGGSETASRLDGGVECFTKPFNVPSLKARIRELLSQRVKGRVENITLPSFLQLLELERKTCTLAITSLGRAGGLFFRAGRLVGATTGELSGQPAALEIVTWEDADIEILDVCPPVDPEIEAGLSYLLMEGMRLQ
ncbi:MAG: response regulator, partial [Thermoanaerobaculia bacterium]